METEQKRCVEIANYMLENSCTVRAAAKHFGISKTTVYNDITDKLQDADADLYDSIRTLLHANWIAKAARGGNACLRKYPNMHEWLQRARC